MIQTMQQTADQVEKLLDRILPQVTGPEGRVAEAMR